MRFHRPSPALVIAFLALLVAAASPAGAAVKKLITGKDIASGAITSSKVKDGTLLSKDFKKGQLPAGAPGAAGARGATGATGATGSQGPQGLQGVKGDRGPAGPTLVGGADDGSGSVGPVGDTNMLTDLAGGASTSGQLVLPSSGTIYANGYGDVSNSTTAAYGRCRLVISDGTGPTNGLTVFSPLAFGNIPTGGGHVSIPVAGQITKPAGTYNIGVSCTAITGTFGAYSAGFTYSVVLATS